MAAQLQEQHPLDAPLYLVVPQAVTFAPRREPSAAEPFSWWRSSGLAAVVAAHGGLLIGLSLPPAPPEPVARESSELASAPVSWADVPVTAVDEFLITDNVSGGADDLVVDDARDGDLVVQPSASRARPRPIATQRIVPVAAPTLPPTTEVPIGRQAAPPTVLPAPPPGGLAEEFEPLIDDLGKARLSDAALDRLDHPAEATDAFHMPGTDGEDDVFYRPPPIEYRETMFEKAWQPSEGLLDELNGKLARAITKQIKIPLNPRFNLVCNVTLLGVGSCNIVRNAGSQVIVERPDPPPWESTNRAQCAELRARLAAATAAEETAFVLDRLQALCIGTPAGSVE